ncbi:S8 family serine peptidase [Streptomyces sp. NPDC050504]|uniref:S8 family serine peptidase n=1 Tax=Streptomyces sp. NPDC050504 TaxID=3365618 RepID=UPI0037B7C955
MAATAAVVSGALVTGMAAADSGTRPDGAGGKESRQDRGSGDGGTASVTLITGDKVVVGAKGKVVGLVRGEGREKVVISVRREAGHVFVVPQDAQALIDAGRLDRRLFDVTRLVADKYDDAHRTSVPLVVGYRLARYNGRAAGDAFKGLVRDRRTLPVVDGEAFSAPKDTTADLWSALTGGTGAAKGRMNLRTTATPAVAHVWLDAKVRPTLDKSVPQIGAPTMWKAGYTGKGVKIAVLDTGVDQTHADLRTVQFAEKNFTESPDAKDRLGHGTHVASIIAGTGAKSGGKYKGAAPDVKVLDGKVIADDGFGTESSIAAGMQWAVDSGAKIVNMSLGSLDSPGTDTLEAAVARLSGKALFVIAAGNDGNGKTTLNSPGSAPAALTVGSVDKQDNLASDSSVGPTADGGAKPDLTAPGVEITAARTTQAEGGSGGEDYVSMSGTSMATPHAAASAAMLLQQHPTWTGQQLKAALIGSAKPNPALNGLQQGAGRIDLTRAVTASVVTEPGTVSFGTQLWPHTDDKPVGKTVTYRNYGTKPVTLALSTTAVDPAGRPGPAGMFTVKDAKLTVPAGGTAKTTVTVNTRLGDADGSYGGTVLAEGDGQAVRTGLFVEREVESYDLKLTHLDVQGKPASSYTTTLTERATQHKVTVPYSTGAATVRLPKGTYALESSVFAPAGSFAIFVQPTLKVGANAAVTLDTRKAKPMSVVAPDRTAKLRTANISYDDPELAIANSWSVDGSTVIRTLGIGPASPSLNAQYNGAWKAAGAAGKGVDYRFAFNRTGSWFSGLSQTLAKADVAAVKYGVGASVTGRKGTLSAIPLGANDYSSQLQTQLNLALPASGTVYVNTKGLRWTWSMAQLDPAGDTSINYGANPIAYLPGKSYKLHFNTGVIGPDLRADTGQGARRAGNSMDAYVRLFNDGSAHAGDSVTTGGFTKLESKGRVVAQGDPGAIFADLPDAPAPYRLSMEATRSPKVASTSTKVAVAWTFTSGRTPDEPPTALPLSTVLLAPNLALNGTTKAGGTLAVPLYVGGAAAGAGKVAALTVKVSYDGGRTWKALPVTTNAKGARSVSVKHPATAGAATYQVYLKDTAGNTVTETITNAYRLVP